MTTALSITGVNGSLFVARSATATAVAVAYQDRRIVTRTTTVHVHGFCEHEKCNNSTTVQHGLENIKGHLHAGPAVSSWCTTNAPHDQRHAPHR